MDINQLRLAVTYDGKYPAACSGRLVIKRGNLVMYDKEHRCCSTGSVWFDDDWGEHVETGELIWRDADKFAPDVQQAVADALSSVHVCCGGCV